MFVPSSISMMAGTGASPNVAVAGSLVLYRPVGLMVDPPRL